MNLHEVMFFEMPSSSSPVGTILPAGTGSATMFGDQLNAGIAPPLVSCHRVYYCNRMGMSQNAAESAPVAGTITTSETSRSWALRLFSKSALKQRKLEMLLDYTGSIEPNMVSLDVGSDNGVISYLLREQGGVWHSGDFIPEAVESIRGLVSTNVVLLDGKSLPFDDNFFDCILIVDFLEHITTDKEFVKDLQRVLKPNGRLIVKVPDPVEGVLRKIPYSLGQADEAHGHVRPGYSQSGLVSLLEPYFTIEKQETYSRFFAELIDLLVTAALDFLKGGGRSKKGTVLTGDDLKKLKKSFTLYSMLYPIMAFCIFLDRHCSFLKGNMRIARCVVVK